MLYQAHHEFGDGSIEFMRQTDIQSKNDMALFLQSVQIEYPTPPGASWLMLPETSSRFMKQAVGEEPCCDDSSQEQCDQCQEVGSANPLNS